MNQFESNPLVPAARPQAEGTSIKLTARPAALSANPGALCLLRALRRRWIAALGLGLLTAGLVGGVLYVLVPRAKYTATSTLHVATKEKRIIFDPQERETDYRTYQKTQLSLFKNLKVLNHTLDKPATLDRPAIAKLQTIREQADPLEWLEQNLKADFPGGGEVLVVSISGDYPADLSVIINEVVASYLSEIVAEEKKERTNRLKQLKALRETYESGLDSKRRALRELAGEVGAADEKTLSLAQQIKTESVGLAQRELSKIRLDLQKAQAELAVAEAAAASRPAAGSARFPSANLPASSPAIDDTGFENDPKVQAGLQALKDAQQRDLAAKRRVINSLDPTRRRAANELAVARKDLDDILKKATAQRAAQAGGNQPQSLVTGGPAGPPSELVKLRSDVAVLKTYQDSLVNDIQTLEKDVRFTTDKGLDLENERAEIAIAQDVFRKVGHEVQAVEVELQAPDRISILAKAKPPTRKDELKRLKFAGGGAAVAFVIALLSVSFWEYRARRVGEAQEIVSGLGMRLVGTIPAQPAKRRLGAPNEIARRWQSRLVESVDAMRALLLHASRNEGTRVVMVTSALKGEGKTSLACHLATSLARGGRRALLIDGDLRSPACHRLFDVPVDPGLCEVLRGECTLEEAIHEGQDFAPAILPAGRIDAYALQSLSQDGFRNVVDQLRERYDFIVVDSAPILPVADSLIVGQAVDAVIFSVLREVSRLPMVYEAHERLSALGVRMIGVVVAGVQEAAHTYEYESQLIA